MKRALLLTISLSLLFMVATLAGHDSGQVAEAKMYDSAAQDVPAESKENKENNLVPPAQVAQVAGALFIENVGQFDKGARFQMWGGDGSVWLAEDGLRITVLEEAEKPAPESRDPDAAPLAKPDPDSASTSSAGVHLQVGFVDANPAPRVEPADRLQTKLSYLMGDDPALWRSDVPVYGSVRYVDLYPGIDLVVGKSPQASSLPWQLVVHEGADLSAVRLRVEGAEELALADNQLNLTTGVGEFRLPLLPVTDPDGNVLAVSNLTGNTPLLKGSEVSAPFATPAPEVAQLGTNSTNNPADLLYSTFLGSSFSDYSSGIAIDGAGNAYVTGNTQSADFPTTPGAEDQILSGREVFVAKLNADGSDLIYATFLGGSGDDYGHAIAVNEAGNAYLMGYTSGSFPTTDDAFDSSYNGGSHDVFLAKLKADGSALEYATYLGGDGDDRGYGLALDAMGNSYITGVTTSSDFSTEEAFDRSLNGDRDIFVAKLNAAGSNLIYATYLGGSGTLHSNGTSLYDYDHGYGIAVDGASNAYVTGTTSSSDFPTTSGAFDTSYDNESYYSRDSFVVKLNAAGSDLVYGTLLGGSREEYAYDIAVNDAGSAYVTGNTHSSDFPTTEGAFDTTLSDYNYDAFVIKLNAAGSDLSYGTFLGGSSYDYGNAIIVDEAGFAYVTGSTSSTDFPTTPNAFDRSLNTDWESDAFVAKLNSDGSNIEYGTYLGGSNDYNGDCYNTSCDGIAIDQAGYAYVTGQTRSSDFPTTEGAFDTTFNSSSSSHSDVFVSKLAMGATPKMTVSPNSLSATLSQGASGSEALTIGNSGSEDLEWQIESDVAWISPNSTNGTLSGGASASVDVGIDASGLAPDVYTGMLTITSNEPSSHSVDVTLTVTDSGPITFTVTVDLVSGWNLVGYACPQPSPEAIADALAFIDGQYSLVYGYENGSYLTYDPSMPLPLNSLKNMKTGYGYWIQASQDTTWTMTCHLQAE